MIRIPKWLLSAVLGLAVAACGSGDGAAPDVPSTGFMGRVSLGSGAPVADALIVVSDARTNVLLARARSNRDGYFLVDGVPRGAEYLVTASDGRAPTRTIKANLIAQGKAAPDAFAWVTPETTVGFRVRSQAPSMAAGESKRRVQRALGLLPDVAVGMSFDMGRLHHNRSQFDHRGFLAAADAVGGIDKLLATLAADALANRSNPGYPVADANPGPRSRALAATPTVHPHGISLSGAGLFIGKGLAGGVLGAVGSLAMGWLLQEIGIPNPTTEAVDKLQQAVAANTAALQDLSAQVATLASDISDLSTAMAGLETTLLTQLAGLQTQIAQSEYQATLQAAESYRNQLSQWMDTLSGYLSQIQSPPAGTSLATIMTNAAAFVAAFQTMTPGPGALQADLLDLLVAQPGTNSLFKQYANVAFGPSYNVINSTGSAYVAAQYQYWTSVMVHAEYMAMEAAHAAYNTTAAQAALANANTYLDGTTQPAQLPAGVALQLGSYTAQGIFGAWKPVYPNVVAGNLMWATDVLPGITSGGPYTLGGSNPPPMTNNQFAGTVAGPNGTTLSGWYMATMYDVLQLMNFPAAAGQAAASFVPGLLGMTPAYAADVATGWWDVTGYCTNNYSVAVVNVLSTTVSSPPSAPACNFASSTGYWFAYRVETNAAQYLPAN